MRAALRDFFGRRLKSASGADANRLTLNMNQVSRYGWSIDWKIKFLEHNVRLITGIPWGQLGDLEVRLAPYGAADTHPVVIPCGDSGGLHVHVSSQDAAKLVALAAFDNSISACVNSADTLGRLINVAYELNLKEREANLWQVAKATASNCPLGVVLHQRPGSAWMVKLRNLRGECQHGDISAVLVIQNQTFGGPPQPPYVDIDYCEGSASALLVADFVTAARNRTFELLRNAAEVIAGSPEAAFTAASTCPSGGGTKSV
jgi:hypothetical protein